MLSFKVTNFGFYNIIFAAVFLLAAGCGGGGGGGSDFDETSAVSPEAVSPEGRESETSLDSLCGIYEQARLVAQPSSQIENVSVQVLSSDAAIITRLAGELAGQQQLVKFHGITSAGIESLRILNGINVLQQELADGAYFVSSGDSCETTFPGGGTGVLGQLYSLAGKSMSERMLMEGSAAPSPTDICEGDLLAQCYATIGIVPRKPTPIELEVQEVSLLSECGVVQAQVAVNPAQAAEGVRVEPLSTDLISVTRLLGIEAGSNQLVKLQGVSSKGVSTSRLEQGKQFIIESSFGGAYLVTDNEECSIGVESGGMAVHGQLFTTSGLSINEELLVRGYALPEADTCGGELLFPCYQTIAAKAPPEPLPEPDLPDSDDSGDGESYEEGIIRNFLWKPVSESNGNLAVLVNPTNVSVVVRGIITETLRNQGPTNGRGTTARAKHPGCAYGNDVVLEFLDSSGQLIPIITGGTTITVPNGCKRFEFRK